MGGDGQRMRGWLSTTHYRSTHNEDESFREKECDWLGSDCFIMYFGQRLQIQTTTSAENKKGFLQC